MDPALPQIGRYRTLAVLGEGGMGTVYLARHPTLGWDLAIKVLLSGRGASNAQRARFARETRALSQLRHPGLVEVVDAGEQDGVPWLAMRRVAGESLEERLRTRGSLSSEEAIALGVQLCAALSAAHAIGILHRDLKPDNVLVTPEELFVVTDFGLTKDLGRDESVRLSKTGALQGTPGYWAPEQAAGQAEASTTSVDVYGVGAVLYAALTGVPPIQGEGLLELVVATQERAPTPPSKLASVSPGLEHVVLRCLEKSPTDRFESLGALGVALRELEGDDQPASGGGSGGSLAPWIAGPVLLGLALVGGAAAWALPEPVPPPPGSPNSSSPSSASSPSPTRSPSPTPTGSRSPLATAPGWYRALPGAKRTPLPLPDGLRFGASSGEYVNHKDGSVLVWVPAGSFAMGSETGDDDQKPVRVVTLANGFFLGKHETTWRQYEAFFDATGRAKPSRVIDARDLGGIRFEAGDSHPVFNVSWEDALAYCRWAGLRLPSEAEWEYGARGSESTTWPWGEAEPGGALLNLADQSADWDSPLKQKQANDAKEGWRDGFAYTAPVGSFPAGASPFGCLDLAGNVAEWVQDAHVNSYEGAPRDGSARDSASAYGRVLRGGSWYSAASLCRSALRRWYEPGRRHNSLGFRPARSLEP